MVGYPFAGPFAFDAVPLRAVSGDVAAKAQEMASPVDAAPEPGR